MKLIELYEKEIRLNSHLDEYSFGKTNYDSILAQEGIFWDGENFEPWSFSDVQSFNVEDRSERIVFYCGKNPLSGQAKTLQEYLAAGGENALKAAKAVIQLLTQAAKDEENIPVIGAGGILVDISESLPKVLILPENLFKYAANALSPEEYTQAHEGWINQTINGLPAICFLRSSIAYHLISGRLPYPSTNSVERNADILDRNFLPLELCLQGIEPALAISVNRALKLNSNAVNVPGKKQKGKSSEDLTPEADFPLELLDKAFELSKKTEIADKDFEEKVAAYKKSQASRIKASRNIRRNSSLIITAAIVMAVLVIITINTIKTRNSELTTKGLTSVQTIQGYFQGINSKDTTMLMNFSKGKKAQQQIDIVSQIYVMHKQRLAYNKDNGYANPESWLLLATNQERWEKTGIYGVTNLKIDELPYELNVKVYQKDEKPEAVTKEGNITLQKGDFSVHGVDFYLLHSEGEDFGFVVEKVHEDITLTYKKDRWVITNIETESNTLPVSNKKFKADYWNAVAKNGGDVLKALPQLRQKYEWLPSDAAMKAEYDAQIYALTHPL
ncbi:MAG: hypothetical protein K5786_10600, partial [Treponema sp.]|nr:hypothetical protein [Treponema sp.]